MVGARATPQRAQESANDLDAATDDERSEGETKMTNDLSLATRGPVAALEFTDEQRQMIRDTYANGANDREFSVLIEIAKKRRLDPMLRQIHFVQRWNNDLKRMVWAPQVSIDGLRAIAQRTGLYDGQDEPLFEDRNGALFVCKVAVYRKDWPRPAVGVAYWSEYVQTTKDGAVTRMWKQMPHVMLSKVAESIALRKAFPEDCGGLYTDDEMGQADNGRDEAKPSTAQPRRAPQLPERTVASIDASAVASLGIEAPPKRPQTAAETTRDDQGTETPPIAQEAPVWRVALDALHESAPDLIAYCNDTERATLPGECVDVWMKHRTHLASLAAPVREAAWKALCARCEEVGRMRNARAWMKKNIAERDAAKAAAVEAAS